MKKKLSILLILALLLTSLPLNSAVASSNSGNDIVIGTNDLDNMILVDTDTITIQDDEGNDLDVTVEEYEEVSTGSEKENGDISPYSYVPEYKIGAKKTWVFKITNAQLGIAGIGLGAPLSSTAKKKLTNAIVKLIGQKIGSAVVPVVGWVSWVASSAGIINAARGKTGFRASINGVYSKHHVNSGGYYLYLWKLSKPSVGTY